MMLQTNFNRVFNSYKNIYSVICFILNQLFKISCFLRSCFYLTPEKLRDILNLMLSIDIYCCFTADMSSKVKPDRKSFCPPSEPIRICHLKRVPLNPQRVQSNPKIKILTPPSSLAMLRSVALLLVLGSASAFLPTLIEK